MATLRRKSSALVAVACLAVGSLACGSDSTDVGTAGTTSERTDSTASALGEPTEYTAANYFLLHGGGISVEYGPIGGATRLIYKAGEQTLTFESNEIATTSTPAGTMVSVPLRFSLDAGSTTLSLLIPRVNLGNGGETTVETPAITATHQFSALPIHLRTGQLDNFTVTPLQGNAWFMTLKPVLAPLPISGGPRLYE
jgi:hypothetical protein